MGFKSQLNGFIFESKLCEYLSNDGYYVIYNEKRSDTVRNAVT